MEPLDSVTAPPVDVEVTDTAATVTLSQTVTAATSADRALAHALLLTVVDTTTGATVYNDLPLDALGTISLPGTGAAPWQPAEVHTFSFTIRLPDGGAADNAYQGASISVDFIWTRSA